MPVKFFHSAMPGAPVLSGSAGALIEVMDTCRSGFNIRAVTSAVHSAGVLTVTAASHGFSPYEVVKLAGANEADFNGEYRVISVPDSGTFTAAIDPAAPAAATGNLTAKYAPISLLKPHADNGRGAYQAAPADSTKILLRIDDTSAPPGGSARTARLAMCESMTSLDTHSGEVGQAWFNKSDSQNSTARSWFLIADDYSFYLLSGLAASAWASYINLRYFGDIITDREADAYHAMLVGDYSAATIQSSVGDQFENSAGKSICRAYHQLPSGPAAPYFYSIRVSSRLGLGGFPHPNPAGNDTLFSMPILISEGAGPVYRGIWPGIAHLLHTRPLANLQVITDIPKYPGEAFIAVNVGGDGGAGQALFKLTGTWR